MYADYFHKTKLKYYQQALEDVKESYLLDPNHRFDKQLLHHLEAQVEYMLKNDSHYEKEPLPVPKVMKDKDLSSTASSLGMSGFS